MRYFKNTELAKLYHVSEKSVRNWITAAQQGKNGLQLFTNEQNRVYLANTTNNTALIEQMVRKGKKFKNKRAVEVITPTDAFYKTFNKEQILDIISNIEVHGEIPHRYDYKYDGADYWAAYTERLYGEEAINMLNGNLQLLDINFASIDRLVGDRQRVNIVDLGPGNGMAARGILEHFQAQGKLHRYIAIDCSQEMLDIAEGHLQKWFDDKLPFEGHVRDFSYQRFDDLFIDSYFSNGETPPINLVLLLGGTLCNFRSQNQALQAINGSLAPGDLMIYATKLDTPNSRRFFDFNVGDKPPQALDYLFRVVVDLLNINESLYEVEQLFDEGKQARFIRIKPKVTLSIKFRLGKSDRYVELQKGEPILLWRYWHQNAIDIINQFDQNDFNLMHASKSSNQEYLLLVSTIKTSHKL
jgi:uncharacterized SAM-dependent methyltransferase